MNLKQYRNPPDLIDRMPNASWFTHAQIFDDVLIVANTSTASFILKTTDGLIIIDAIYPKEQMFNAIIDGIKDIGWNPKDIKKLVITHGHFDHCGCGKWIVANYHPETYLSKIDDEYWRNVPFFPDKQETWKDFDIDHYVDDGDEISLGETTIKVIFTPGHTPGGLSFIFPVHDNGVLHMAGMWGGTNPPGDINGVVTYFQSLDHFMEEAEKYHCDVTINNHPTMDGYDKIAYANHRCSHMPNIYVIGEAGFRHFCQLYRFLCYDKLLEIANTLEK
ncbi:MAG: MBL fold metallo-hydrolase [Veillonellales bacterium]